MVRNLISRVKAARNKASKSGVGDDSMRAQYIGNPAGRQMMMGGARSMMQREGDGPDRMNGVTDMLRKLRNSRGRTLVG